MKTKIYLFLFLLLPCLITAQESRKVELTDGTFVVPDKYPEIIKYVKPKFPTSAIMQDIQGKVYVKITIELTGKIEKVKLVKGISQSLNTAALDAAKKMLFTPAIYKGKPVKSSIAVPINFILDPGQEDPELKIGNLKTEKMQMNGGYQDLLKRSPNYGVQKQKETIPDPSSFTPVEKEPTPISFVKPVYPEEAQKKGLTGMVILRVLVSKEGKPIRIIVFRGDNELFIKAAKDAAMATLFTPAIQVGKPIMCWVNMPYKFSLANKK